MKKIFDTSSLFTLLLALLSLIPVSVWGAWKGSAPAAGDFYLYNVGQRQFIQMNSDHTPGLTNDVTNATSFTITGSTSTISYKDDNTTYYLYQSKGTYQSSTNGHNWTIEKFFTNSGEMYRLKSRNGDSNDRYAAVDNNSVNATKDELPRKSAYAQWRLVSQEEVLYAQKAIDITSQVVVNANFSGTNGWNGLNNNQPKYVDSNAAEAWNTTFDVYQTITGLTPGRYKIEAKAFYRYDSQWNYNSSSTVQPSHAINSFLYAKDGEATEVTVPVVSILSGSTVTEKVKDDIDKNYFFFPNNTSRAQKYCNDGAYDNTLYVDVTSGTLHLGIKCQNNQSNSWTYFDEFRLSYVPFPVFEYKAEAAENDNTLGSAFVSFTGFNDANEKSVFAHEMVENFAATQSSVHNIYFKAVKVAGANFEGWYPTATDAVNKTNLITTDEEYQTSVVATSTDKNSPTTVSAYAKFVSLYDFTIDCDKTDLKVEETTEFTYTYADAANTTIQVATSKDDEGNWIYEAVANQNIVSLSALVNNKITLIANHSGEIAVKFAQPNASATIKAGEIVFELNITRYSTELTKNDITLEYYTTYDNLASFVSSNSDGAITFHRSVEGEDIQQVRVNNETSLTLYVSQAATNKFEGIENMEFTFPITAAAGYSTIIATKSAMSKLDGSRDNFTWVNNGYEADSILFYSTTSNNTRHYRLYQYINGVLNENTYYTIDNAAGDKKFALNPAATGVQIRNEGTGWGSATVSNLVATRRTYLKSETAGILEHANISEPIEKELAVEYGNIHNVQYELTDITPANANISLTTEETIRNGERDYGTYTFKVSASSEAAGTITAKAHFFTSEDKHLIVPIEIKVRQNTTITPLESNVALYAGGAGYTIYATSTSDAEITYRSSDEAKATVNNNGVVTPLAAGEVTITIAQAATDAYQAAESTITLTITAIDTEDQSQQEAKTTTVTVTDENEQVVGYYASFCAQYNFRLEGATAYKGRYNDQTGNIQLTSMGDDVIVPAGEGVIIVSQTQNYTIIPTAGDATADTEGNILVGTIQRTPLASYRENDNFTYALNTSTNKFGKYTGAYMPAGKAFIVGKYDGAAAPLRIVVGNSHPVATDIHTNSLSTDAHKVLVDGHIYILRGNRMFYLK